MIDEIREAAEGALERIGADLDASTRLAGIEHDLVGKRSALGTLKSRLGGLDPDERKVAGQALNEATARVSDALAQRRAAIETLARNERIAERATRPDRGARRGRSAATCTSSPRRTPTSRTCSSVSGFTVSEGPEVESDWNNFTALNLPPEHPARSMWDTIFVDLGEPGSVVLRTHTSPVQIRVMQSQPPPIYTIMPGRVFRRDTADSTHMPVFHQIEGLVIDRGITFGDLSGTIDQFTKAYFGREFRSRLAAVVLPVHRAVRRVRHPAPRRVVARARRVRHGPSQRACATAASIPKSGAASHSGSAPIDCRSPATASTTCARCSRTTSGSWSSSDAAWSHEDRPLVAERARARRRRCRRARGADERPRPRGRRRREGRSAGRRRRSWRRCSRLRPHPDANHVQRVDVDMGDGEPLQVWCGAFNMQVGDLVPLATVGTTMPNGMQIGRRKILGEPSNGMLCSPGRDRVRCGGRAASSILPPDLPLGAPLWDALAVDADVVFDLDLTRNRPDAYSHAGVARDLAARLGVPLDVARPRGRRSRALDRRRRDDRRREGMRAVHRASDHRCARHRVAGLDGRAADPRRHAPDQQRRRRLQLRDARARAAEPHVRPREARGRRLSHPQGA